MITVGKTYNARNGDKFTCLYIDGGVAYMQSKAGIAYTCDKLSGAALVLNKSYDIILANSSLGDTDE
jgi:hypothetical protein